MRGASGDGVPHRPPGVRAPGSDRVRLFDTPQTLVIDSEGRVEKAWLGAMTGTRLQDAERYFGVNLPGIQKAKREEE